jgi:hypothetical protein
MTSRNLHDECPSAHNGAVQIDTEELDLLRKVRGLAREVTDHPTSVDKRQKLIWALDRLDRLVCLPDRPKEINAEPTGLPARS